MRRANDFYPTPAWATRELLRQVAVQRDRVVFEPCVGNHDIEVVLADACLTVVTSDIDQSRTAFTHGDAATEAPYRYVRAVNDRIDWVITNPPFNQAAKIVPMAYDNAGIGIAMLLRLSFLEPVEDRGKWLNEHPPTELIVLPRISFTGDGKTDSVTCAWFVWWKGREARQQRIVIAENPRFTQATASLASSALLPDVGVIPS